MSSQSNIEPQSLQSSDWVFLSSIQKIHPTSHQFKLRHFDEKLRLPATARIGIDPDFGITCELTSLQENWLTVKGWKDLELEDLQRLCGQKLWLPTSSLTLPLWSSFLGLQLVDQDGHLIGETLHFVFGHNRVFLKITTPLQKIDLPLVSEQFVVEYQKGKVKKLVCKVSKNDLEEVYGKL